MLARCWMLKAPPNNDSWEEERVEELTPRIPTANRLIRRILRIPANIPHARVIQALVAKVLAVHVLDAPEAACSNRCALGARWDCGAGCGGGGGCVGRHDGGGGEWAAEEAGDEEGHEL